MRGPVCVDADPAPTSELAPGIAPGFGPLRCADLRLKADPTGGYPGPAALGQESPFRFEIDNDGNETATGVRVELTTTAAIEIIDGNGEAFPCSGGPRDLVCSLPPLSPTSVRTVSFRVRSPAAGGNDYLDAGNGNDIVVGGPGRDEILAKGGSDTIYTRDGQKDWIDCGTERDVAIVDGLDVVKRCETVVRPRRKP